MDHVARADLSAFRDYLLIEDGKHHGSFSKYLSFPSAVLQEVIAYKASP